MVVSADPVGQDDLWDVTIVSRSDALNVSRIAVNQNNCKGTVQLRAQLPVMLRFGESFRYRVFPCHPIQVAVEANGRTELFDFGEPIDPGKDLGVSADLYGGSKSLYNKLVVTSYADLTLSRVTINRGNCGPFGDVKIDPPREMHFGDYYIVSSFSCQPIEVTAATNKGPITITLK